MQYQFSMNESVESVTRKLVALCKTQKAPESRAQMFRLFQLLCSMKFDFYLILSILCNLNEFSTSELKIILQASPSPDQILQPTPQNIRITIPRWTPSKYHSGRIADIVTDVYEKIDRALPGIYIYNSNLNPKNARSLNDLYVLVIVENSIRWYDINRRCNYSFSKPTITEEVYTHVENTTTLCFSKNSQEKYKSCYVLKRKMQPLHLS